MTTWKAPITGTETLVSIEKARRLIDFEPAYSIRRYFDVETAPEPEMEKAVALAD